MNWMDILQLSIGLALIVFVIMQYQDAGLYSNTANINRTRRGPDKFIFRLTIFLVLAFTITSITNFII